MVRVPIRYIGFDIGRKLAVQRIIIEHFVKALLGTGFVSQREHIQPIPLSSQLANTRLLSLELAKEHILSRILLDNNQSPSSQLERIRFFEQLRIQ
jgi:hypothetical protein